MKLKPSEWLLGTLTTLVLGMGAFVGNSFDTRLSSAHVRADLLEKEQNQMKLDEAVYKEIVAQINRRLDELGRQQDQVLQELQRR